MNWRNFYGLKSFLRSSLWVVPFIAIPIELVVTRLAHGLDAWLGWNFLGFALPGAQALLQATITATLSFVVFTFGSLLVAIQVVSAQLTPRIIATTLLRNSVVKYTVGLFIFTMMFALSAFSEIRSCGSNNLQIVRRLRAMIDNLVQTLPAQCHSALQEQLSLLDRGVTRNFTYLEELALARIADSQGLGGRSGNIRGRHPGGEPNMRSGHVGS